MITGPRTPRFALLPALACAMLATQAHAWHQNTDPTETDASFEGNYDTGFSYDLAMVGDVNGDGYDDFLIGAYYETGDYYGAGAAYLYFGSDTGWAQGMDTTDADASFVGNHQYQYLGYSVAGAGDVNGDGYDDILIGAYEDDNWGNSRGAAYLFYGSDSGWAMDTSINDADASFYGEANYDDLSREVAGAGDVNGDGYDDILIGAPYNDENGSASGQSYLFLGSAAGFSPATPASDADASFLGEYSSDYSGYSVAGAGDVNGDGYHDFLIGARGNDENGSYSGQAYLFLGASTLPWTMDTSLGSADASFQGETSSDEAGYSVDGAGDVNGDGYDDLLIGAPEADYSYYEGAAYIAYGGSPFPYGMDTSLANVDASFYGESYYSGAGARVAGTGDVNDDGYDDFLVSAPWGGWWWWGNNCEVYLVWGSDSLAMDSQLADVEASFEGSSEMGYGIDGGGDVNGDGTPDFLFGDPWNYPNYVGTAYLVLQDTDCADDDGDGYEDVACGGTDCDDTDAQVNPGQYEVCNGIDDDCDDEVDEDDAIDVSTWYEDADGDTYGDANVSDVDCDQPTGYVEDDTDCDDTDDTVYPGADEYCNSVDDDCNGTIDDDYAVDALTWYEDDDGDGFGDQYDTTEACEEPTGFVADDTDCDDYDVDVNPDADEVCDYVDNDCDGEVDEGDALDATTWYADDDNDGYGDPDDPLDACYQPAGYEANDDDCDDGDININPGEYEWCDGIDNDCDGEVDEDDALDVLTWYLDGDSDGYGNAASSTDACDQPTGYVANSTDCDDGDAAQYPGADEYCNNEDDDCDGTVDEDALDAPTWYEDDDGDTYGDPNDATDDCDQPTGYVSNSDDCDDTDAAINPDADELCDGVDNDCDGEVDEDDAIDESTWYEDADGDTYGNAASTTEACDEPTGYVADNTDCDDTDADINPGAAELFDGVDQDCDGLYDNGAFPDDALVVTEVMKDPSMVLDTAGEWFELTNTTDMDVNLFGMEVQDLGNDSFTVDVDLIVPAGDIVVFARDETEVDNGGVTVDFEYGTQMTLANADDEIILIHAGDVLDIVAYDDGVNWPDPTGATMSLDPDFMDDNGEGSHWCEGEDVYGDGDYGTPGDANPDCCFDGDEDGYTDEDCGGDDCDDGDADIFPGADEECDGVDNDCDDEIDEDDAIDASTWYADDDGDGYGDAGETTDACDQPTGYVANDEDCDDDDIDINPAADEVCDGEDNDCDGTVDEDDAIDATTWYLDLDGDGYGNPYVTTVDCDQPNGFENNSDDCDDTDDEINPGADELCDGEDNDCDGEEDEDDAIDAQDWYRDADGDGYGDPNNVEPDCYQPTGYITDDNDCDDADADQFPGADEYCNGEDDDCDGTVDEDDALDVSTWYEDADGDSYGNAAVTDEECYQPTGYVGNDDDCDDGDAAQFPGADEYCNGEDDDCDNLVDEDQAVDVLTWYEDGDGDTFGNAAVTDIDCAQPTGYVADDTDCDDTNAAVYPGADETCNGLDDNCDGEVDEDGAIDVTTWYEDFDGDGYGNAAVSDVDCDPISGYVADGTDCDDTSNFVYPGAPELCDTVDNDCNGVVDDGVATQDWWPDADGDGYGETGSQSVEDCAVLAGHALNEDDCDDTVAAVNPGAEEVCDGIDNDCDGTVDGADAADAVDYYADTDQDGFGDANAVVTDCTQPAGYVEDATDCDDGDASQFPGADEVCNGEDDDCDQQVDEDDAIDVVTWYQDVDGDGFGNAAETDIDCDQPQGYVQTDGDCDDLDPLVNPAELELCNGIDDDCDGEVDEDDALDVLTWYADLDGDGFGDLADTIEACAEPQGYVLDGADCDDTDPDINPVADELCDGIDNDCDGVVDGADALDALEWYVDADGDGYGNDAVLLLDCEQPDGYAAVGGDCEDLDPAINPGADEVCDGEDNDCDGVADGDDALDVLTWYEDMDGDGWGDPAVSETDCNEPQGFVAVDGDCDDLDPAVNPAAEEVCDGIDNDCDETTDELGDADGDGYSLCDDDCDDDEPAMFPGNPEICDGLDNDCDETTDEELDGDGDFYSVCSGDCDDDEPAAFPGNLEICDGIDNDCDGLLDVDEVDADGDGQMICEGDCDDDDVWTYDGAPEQCDGIDNDCDGVVDNGVDQDLDGDGYNACQGDCDNNDANVYPYAPEICDGKDDDCDGDLPLDELDEDADGWLVCDGDCDDLDEDLNLDDIDLDGFSTCDDDCDDEDDTLTPEDLDGDGFSSCDDDCDDSDDTLTPEDLDGDGFSSCDGDCDDDDPDVNPDADEVPYDGVDNDCDGSELSDVDGDGFDGGTAGDDCDDDDPDVNPDADEICDDGIDNDCDGLVDMDDLDDCDFVGDDDDTSADDDDDDTSIEEPDNCTCRQDGTPASPTTLALAALMTALLIRRRS